MERTQTDGGEVPVGEMVIVDTFTRLIFGEEQGYSERELRIIQALRQVDRQVILDSHHDIGEYLRALGVREMIGLVTRVRQQLADSPAGASCAAGRASLQVRL